MNDDQKIWCKLCQVFVLKSELIKWTGDDMLHFLCPGCDSDLIEARPVDECHEAWSKGSE